MQSVVDTSGHSSMVELQPSKLAVRVRFPLPAPEIIVCPIFGVRKRQLPQNAEASLQHSQLLLPCSDLLNRAVATDEGVEPLGLRGCQSELAPRREGNHGALVLGDIG